MFFFDIFKGTKSNNEMQEYLKNEFKRRIIAWDKGDIYAISLYLCDNCDNPCEPTVTLGYNTETNFKKQIPEASDELEARWNFAFWLQNEEFVFGTEDTQHIVKKWIKSKKYCYYTYDEIFDVNNELDPETYEGITKSFVDELIQIVKELHASGFITEQFGRPIPIIIHELEYYDEIAQQNAEANPPETVKEFIEFCCNY